MPRKHNAATECLLAAARVHEVAGTLIFERKADARQIEAAVVQLQRTSDTLLKLQASEKAEALEQGKDDKL